MLKIHTNYSLKNNTTFGVDIACSWFSEPENITELKYIIKYAKERSWKSIVIGEGSNLLFTNHYEGLIIHPLIKGIEIVDESDSEILLRVGAGENWDEFVKFCVQNDWFGAENLSMIPGSVGAAAVQNIGAYGVEAKDIIEYVEVVDKKEMKIAVLSNSACEFAYRDSIFKHVRIGRYIITHTVFKLSKNKNLTLNYGNVKEEFLKSPEQNLISLRNTIISIRESKLPDPELYGNAGSYFKNPVIKEEKYQLLKTTNKSIPSYPASPGKVKIPAAWLIDNAGWKGIREEDVGTWPKQALVIVNYGKATGKEIFAFSESIRKSVEEKFGIDLEREVTVID